MTASTRTLLAVSFLAACSPDTLDREDTRLLDANDSDDTGVDTDTEPKDPETFDPFDPIWDSPVEWSVAPSSPRPSDGGPCGVESDGTYLGPCELQLADDWVSTLCDEARKTCVAPVENCRRGWCYVPPRSYLANGSLDVTWWGDIRIGVMPRGIYVTQTEITRDTFERLMGYLPDIVSCGPECPATGITLFEAMELANRLSDLHGLDQCHLLEDCGFVDLPWPNAGGPDTRSWMCGSATFAGPQCNGYRLPSTREAELAIRSGSPFCLGRGPLDIHSDDCEPRDPKSYAQQHVVFCGNARSTTDACPLYCSQNGPVPGPCWPPQEVEPDGTLCLSPQDVRAKRTNDFGLYGAYGNVLEWALSEADGSPLETPGTIGTASEFVDYIRWSPDEGRHQRVAFVSGIYYMPLDRQCGGHVSPASVSDVVSMVRQTVGFRLVRTAGPPTTTH